MGQWHLFSPNDINRKKSPDDLCGSDRELYSSATLANPWITPRSLLFGVLACLYRWHPLSQFFLPAMIIVCLEVISSQQYIYALNFSHPVLDFWLSWRGAVCGSGSLSWEWLGGVNHLYQNCTYFCVLLRNLTPDPDLLFLLFDGNCSYLWNNLLQWWK